MIYASSCSSFVSSIVNGQRSTSQGRLVGVRWFEVAADHVGGALIKAGQSQSKSKLGQAMGVDDKMIDDGKGKLIVIVG